MAQKCDTIQKIKTISAVWDAQFLLRYHTVAMQSERQTVGAHSYAVSVLIDQLWPDSSKQLIMAALYHDVPEIILGDIPATAKWEYPEIQQAFEKAEQKVFKELGLTFVLTPEEERRLKMADMLELVLYAKRHSGGNPQMKKIMESGVEYLYSKFVDDEEFKPVEAVLNHNSLTP